MPWTELLFLLIFYVSSASTLSCLVCGDTNLDEFGECSSQFQYDCGTYESRFPADERIFCRTTRHRAKNNTFTVMKECISEQDHYRTFPEKGYKLDEECDLVDIQGEEVAYCLCRNNDCNNIPIAEQFMSFEEKHPELFGDIEAPAPPPPKTTSFRVGEAPLKIQALPTVPQPGTQPAAPSSFAAPILQPPAIVPINDLRTQSQTKSSEVIEIRRSQLPTRVSGVETEISAGASRPITSSRETEVPIMNLPRKSISEGTFVGSGPIISPVIPRRGEQMEIRKETMKCIQCGDGNLQNEKEECKRQVQVDCQSERSLCFTRQIAIGNGMYGMEKMCVLPEQLVNEFGEAARNEGCGSSNGGRVQYCACSSPSCNQLPLFQQRQIFNVIAPSNSPNVPDLASPDLPIRRPVATTTTTSTTTTTTSTTTQKPIIPIVHRPSAPTSSGFRCLACLETDMSDPTADCAAISEEPCTNSAKFCVTKQTQISTSSFAMEKKCMSVEEAAVFLPGEKITEGCATSEGGLVNYCICTGNLCNRLSLLQQAQITGVRDSLEEQRILEEEVRKQQELTKSLQTNRIPTHNNVGLITSDHSKHIDEKKLPPVFLDEDDTLEVAKDVRTEDDIITDRQKEWAKAEVSSSGSMAQHIIFILLILQFL